MNPKPHRATNATNAAERGETAPRPRAKRERVRPVLVALRATAEGAELSQAAASAAISCGERLVWELEQEPQFWADVHAAVLDLERAHLGAVYRALRNKALEGDVPAVKLYLSQAGVLAADKLEVKGSLAVTASAEWRSLRAVILSTAEHYPDAADRILQALEGERE